MDILLEARFDPTPSNCSAWNCGDDVTLSWVRVQTETGDYRPATQDDIDNCTQNWRQHGPGWYMCDFRQDKCDVCNGAISLGECDECTAAAKHEDEQNQKQSEHDHWVRHGDDC